MSNFPAEVEEVTLCLYVACGWTC